MVTYETQFFYFMKTTIMNAKINPDNPQGQIVFNNPPTLD
jgi:hypothetical protein